MFSVQLFFILYSYEIYEELQIKKNHPNMEKPNILR